MSCELYDQTYVDNLKTMQTAMTSYMASNGVDALWKRYEIRNRVHERKPVWEALQEINRMLKEAIACRNVSAGSARNQAGFARHPN